MNAVAGAANFKSVGQDLAETKRETFMLRPDEICLELVYVSTNANGAIHAGIRSRNLLQ